MTKSKKLNISDLFVGQVIIVPPNGAGTVKEVAKQAIEGVSETFIKVAFERPGITSFSEFIPTSKIAEKCRVPVNHRTVMEAAQILSGKKDGPVTIKTRVTDRKRQFDEFLLDGEILVIAQLLRFIHEKSLASNERLYSDVYNKALSALASEFSITTEVGNYSESVTLIKGIMERNSIAKEWKVLLKARKLLQQPDTVRCDEKRFELENRRLKTELTEAQELVRMFEGEIASLTNERDYLLKQVRSLNEQVASLQEAASLLAAVQQENEQLRVQLVATKTELETVRAQVEEPQDDSPPLPLGAKRTKGGFIVW